MLYVRLHCIPALRSDGTGDWMRSHGLQKTCDCLRSDGIPVFDYAGQSLGIGWPCLSLVAKVSVAGYELLRMTARRNASREV